MSGAVFAQQIDIPRVEMMPNMPSPYSMRNWKQVARGYDSLTFDLNASGQHLPLSWIYSNTVNYQNHESFGIDSYVGWFSSGSGEAINVLAAVVGASLAGIDKSNQSGYNWVLMCEEFFNRRPEENVYLNAPVTSSGNDWWYDTMPNVFFYQLHDMYPSTGDFDYQFTAVADRWLEAVEAMGGSTTPWQKPYMNYRAWHLAAMTPNTGGVSEPEAAGAIAWLLYNAYVETGNQEYLIGAEWAMEFLSGWAVNPSYELQLPYGAYTAARINAEIGTTYDIEKMVNWCFDLGPLRLWGVVVGNWGGYDCSGLVGEATGPGHYAFIMNGFEQVGALVPLVRYDDRFARAIGKWVLNVANASRLFYSQYLPDQNQDNEDWVNAYDPNSYISYEGLRRVWSSVSPYATGDAMAGGWAATNLGLYGSSHVGIFAGIIDTTNVEMILRLDALKTDYFCDEAYPTHLYFNPFSEDKSVEIDVGNNLHDIYDAVTNNFLLMNVTGTNLLTIPADAAVLAVTTPAGGNVTYHLDKMLIDGIVADYRSSQMVNNYPPRIRSLAADLSTVFINEMLAIYCTAVDKDYDSLDYLWNATAGVINGSGSEVIWTAADSAGLYAIRCVVSDGRGGHDTAEVWIQVTDNHVPVISTISGNPNIIDVGESTELTCIASDSDNDSLSYYWSSGYGLFTGSGATVTWTAPDTVGYYHVNCVVDDGRGGQAADSIGIIVGKLVAFYPFSDNADDESGFGNHGIVSGATPADDRFGNPNSAYFFDGADDFVRVPNHASLNFQDEITLNFWMSVGEFFQREAYPISHGNWENRWKVSITNGNVRWTIKTDTTANSGIRDLDSQTQLILDSLYNFTVLYDGVKVEIYVNAVLDASSSWSGQILQTPIDLTIGQHLPGNNNYNFKGVLDDIRIFNYALSHQEIQDLYSGTTAILEPSVSRIPDRFVIHQNYPNPFNPSTTIEFEVPEHTHVSIIIYDILGRRIYSLVDEKLEPGKYKEIWNGIDINNNLVASRIYFIRMEAKNFVKVKKMMLIK
jgi:hypothetical protein